MVWGLKYQRGPIVEDMVVFTKEEDEMEKQVEATEKIVENFYTGYKISTGTTYFWNIRHFIVAKKSV